MALDETTEDVLKEPKKEKAPKDKPAKEPEVVELTEQEKFDVHRIELRRLSGIERFALLKKKLRTVGLEKEEAGYNSQYFYVSLQDMQKVFTELEHEFSLTSFYTEETIQYYRNEVMGGAGGVRNFASRECIDLVSGETIRTTKIDITNLKQLSDVYHLEKDVLRISTPKDAISTLLYDFLEPQGVGSISTYMQRYTYNQLYDFQETKADKVEQNGRLKDKEPTTLEDEKKPKAPKVTKETKEVKEPKTERLNDEAMELRTQIKNEFEREDIIQALDGRQLKAMNKAEATEFYAYMCEKYTKKGEL